MTLQRCHSCVSNKQTKKLTKCKRKQTGPYCKQHLLMLTQAVTDMCYDDDTTHIMDICNNANEQLNEQYDEQLDEQANEQHDEQQDEQPNEQYDEQLDEQTDEQHDEQHGEQSNEQQDEQQDEQPDDKAYCCFCNRECNPNSQACGPCKRSVWV